VEEVDIAPRGGIFVRVTCLAVAAGLLPARGWTWKGPRRPVDNEGRTRCRRDVPRSEGCLGLFLAQQPDRL